MTTDAPAAGASAPVPDDAGTAKGKGKASSPARSIVEWILVIGGALAVALLPVLFRHAAPDDAKLSRH